MTWLACRLLLDGLWSRSNFMSCEQSHCHQRLMLPKSICRRRWASRWLLDVACDPLAGHGCRFIVPCAPCMVYLPTFGWFLRQMLVNIPYMEHMGIWFMNVRSCFVACRLQGGRLRPSSKIEVCPMIEPPLGMVDLMAHGICCASTDDCFGIWVVWGSRGGTPLLYCWFIRFYKDNLGQDWTSMIPSGKRLHNYGNSTCLMCNSTMSMAIFNSKLLNYRRVKHKIWVSQSKAQRKRLPVISIFPELVQGKYIVSSS